MRRRNLIATRKANKNQLLIKDQKILNFYSRFKSIVFKDIKRKDFAIAVSGGADSLCLAYFSKMYSIQSNSRSHVLIVDHKLRKESSREALRVKRILFKKNIYSKILKWSGKVPISNIQKNARDMRYALLSNYCAKNNKNI